MKRVLLQSVILGFATLCASQVAAGEKKQHTSKLQVVVNDAGQIVLTWNGKEELAEARGKDGKFKRIHKSTSPYVVAPTEDGATYRLEADNCNCYSVNAVGYANLQLPPGLSLIANPLYYTNNDLGFWMPNPPDGSQVYKYTATQGYEVSTFDGIAGEWSNPSLQVEIGTGFFFRNTLRFGSGSTRGRAWKHRIRNASRHADVFRTVAGRNSLYCPTLRRPDQCD